MQSQIPFRTRANWDAATPGFVEIELVGHEGDGRRADLWPEPGRRRHRHWGTEPRALRNEAERWVHAAVAEMAAALPFPIKGMDSDSGSEFINADLLR